jgi:hypothetical protein
MSLGTQTILHLMMGPSMLSKSIPSTIAKIYVSWTQANRIVFNNESWFENTNSIELTPTNATIYGISGNVKASMQTIIGNSPILICPDMNDNLLSQG